MSERPKRTWPAIAFLVVIVQLVLFDTYVIVRNQLQFEPNDRIASRSGNIEVVASHNPMHVVRSSFATYHRLRSKFAGKTVVISPNRVPHQFHLERVARLNIEVAPKDLVFPFATVDQLFVESTARWMLEDAFPFLVIEDPAATKYYLVWRDDMRAEVLLSEARYREVLATLEKK